MVCENILKNLSRRLKLGITTVDCLDNPKPASELQKALVHCCFNREGLKVKKRVSKVKNNAIHSPK
uniref:Uncharacterized protein n=1 Tax=Anguilla anguilla TaxID=7936 RepID=A0A0E9S4Q3_ANGAN